MKEDLRPVEIDMYTDYLEFNNKGLYKGNKYKGYFHGFFTIADENGSDCMATVELMDGNIITIGAGHIRFLDR